MIGASISALPQTGPIPVPTRNVRILTLTPFYPSVEDPARGCFIAEPLLSTQRIGVGNYVLAAQPFYRSGSKRIKSPIESAWRSYFSIPGNLGLPNAGMFLASAIKKTVGRLHASQPFDLIHAHAALPCGDAAASLSRWLGIPFVVSVHGMDAFFERQAGPALARWCHSKSAGVFRRARAVVCVSEKVRSAVAAETEARTTVIYNGVDADRFCPAPESSATPTILSVGNLIPTKDHTLLLRAFAEISMEFELCRLEIIGEGTERARLVSLAADLGIAGKVTFHGKQSREVVARAMQSCSIFALPSRYEGLGCVYLEAMACGKPAIGCAEQGIDEVINHGDNGFLVSPGSKAELVQNLRVLLLNQDLRRRIGAAARKTIEKRHTLKHQALQLRDLYLECLS